MGGSSSRSGTRSSSSTESNTVTPTGIKKYQDEYAKGYQDIYGQYKDITNQPLNLKSAPIYSKTLDPIVQNQISKGMAGLKANQATMGKQTANVLGQQGSGNNSALLNVLNRQSAISGGAMGNQLYGIGQEQQRAQDLAKQGVIRGQNADMLAKRQAEIAGLTPGMGLLNTLIQMGTLSRGTQSVNRKKSEERYNEKTDKSFI